MVIKNPSKRPDVEVKLKDSKFSVGKGKITVNGMSFYLTDIEHIAFSYRPWWRCSKIAIRTSSMSFVLHSASHKELEKLEIAVEREWESFYHL